MELPLLKLLSKKSNCWLENTKKQLTFFFLYCFISIDKKHCKKKSNKFTVYHILLTWTSLKRRKTCDTLFRGNFFGKLCKRVLFIYSSPYSSSFLVFFFFFFIYLHRVHDRHLYTTSTISPVSTEIAATTTFFPYHPLVFHKQSKLNPALIGSVWAEFDSKRKYTSFPASVILAFVILFAMFNKLLLRSFKCCHLMPI